MSELALVAITRDSSNVTATLTGEVDASNADQVRAELEAAVTPPTLTVDLSGLSYLDSAGVRVM